MQSVLYVNADCVPFIILTHAEHPVLRCDALLICRCTPVDCSQVTVQDGISCRTSVYCSPYKHLTLEMTSASVEVSSHSQMSSQTNYLTLTKQ